MIIFKHIVSSQFIRFTLKVDDFVVQRNVISHTEISMWAQTATSDSEAASFATEHEYSNISF